MKQKNSNWLKESLIKVSKLQLVFVVLYIAQIIAYDAAKLITPETVLNRWYAAAGLTVVATLVWYVVKTKTTSISQDRLLVWLLIIANILFATYNVYAQRGMASKAIVFFFIPVIISAVLLSRAALFSTAILCIAAYTTAAVAYFVNYFNEGYKIELYGEILFYSSTLILVSALTWIIVKNKPIS